MNLTLTPDISKCFILPDCSVYCSQPLRLSKFTVGARLVLNCLSVVNLVVYLVNIYADNFVVVDEIADIISKYSLTTLTPSFHKVPKKNAREVIDNGDTVWALQELQWLNFHEYLRVISFPNRFSLFIWGPARVCFLLQKRVQYLVSLSIYSKNEL